MKKLTIPLSRFELIFGWIYLPFQLLVLPSLLLIVNLFLGNPFSESEINFIYFCLNFLVVTVAFRRFLIHSAKRSLSSPMRCLQSAFFGFVLYWAASIGLSSVIVYIDPSFFNVNDESINAMVKESAQLMAIGTVFLVPVVEEVLYRGLIFRGLYNRSKIAAYVVSSLAFSAIHVVGYIGLYDAQHLLLCLLQYLPAGLCLGWSYARADSIWAPILIHITINQIGILSMG